jgi:hypothetical protein
MTITAKVIADSINENGVRITTMEVEYPRFIHGEFMTHRMFSRNAASSRAIPVSKMLQLVEASPAEPVHWGKNQSGMQAKEELTGITKIAVRDSWLCAAKEMSSRAKIMSAAGLHKQVVNRLLEPFQTIKVVVTATEWNNFWWLRDHPDAQPEIQKLARVMKGVYEYSKPVLLRPDMWHLPYVNTEVREHGVFIYAQQHYFDEYNNEISLEEAIKISCSSCAQVSYRKLDTSLEKAEDIYKKLVESEPVHASSFEHVAKCVDTSFHSWHEGMTHQDFDDNMWSGNFKDWVQYRQLIPNNVKKG